VDENADRVEDGEDEKEDAADVDDDDDEEVNMYDDE
jgi:hypothetical protein